MSVTMVRMRFYQEVASLFASPGPEVLERLASANYIRELSELGSLHDSASVFLGALERESVLSERRASHEDIATLYTTSFEVPNPPVSLAENSYGYEAIATLFEDLYRVYEYFGLNFEQGTIRERPDVLTVELDFMQYLVYLESHQPRNITPLRRAQRDFLDRHLAPFVTSLMNKLQQKNISPYQELATLLNAFILAEKDTLQAYKDPNYLRSIIQTKQIDAVSTDIQGA